MSIMGCSRVFLDTHLGDNVPRKEYCYDIVDMRSGRCLGKSHHTQTGSTQNKAVQSKDDVPRQWVVVMSILFRTFLYASLTGDWKAGLVP